MNEHETEHLAHLLERLSTIEPGAGAIDQALDRTRKALADASKSSGSVQPGDDHRHAWRVSRWAVAVAIVVMIALGLAGPLIFPNYGSRNAFAKVQAALGNVPSVAFSVDWVKVPEGCDTRKTKTVGDMARSRVRWETVDGEEISIYDAKRGIWLQLFPRQKRAILMTGMQKHDQSPGFNKFLEEVRKAKSDCVERLPDAELDGRKVERYRIPPDAPLGEGTESLLFVDPQTKLPVRSEAIGRDNDGRVIIRAVLTDFSFEPCDASMFDLVPPKGYHLEKTGAEETEAASSTPFAEIAPLPAMETA